MSTLSTIACTTGSLSCCSQRSIELYMIGYRDPDKHQAEWYQHAASPRNTKPPASSV
jgi:hypothetical protein